MDDKKMKDKMKAKKFTIKDSFKPPMKKAMPPKPKAKKRY